MRLYTFPFAPNPNKLRVYLVEKQIELDTEIVNLVHAEQKTPEHLARNPLAKLPVLELDDGSYLTESLAIIEYLEELHPEPPMIGRTPLERARVREIERIAELSVLGPAARAVHATKSPLGSVPVPEIANAALAALPSALGVLEEHARRSAFLAGDTPTIADCTLFAAVCFARFADISLLELGEGFPALRTWFDRFEARPGIKQ